jgi:hypothetical protein
LDTNDGKTAATAWQTIAKVNAAALVFGNVVAFCGGQTFSGTLTIPAGGSPVAPITFMSYGVGRATIAPAANSNGILGLNTAYITVRDLIVVGTGQTTSLADGVRFDNNQAGNTKLNDISLINLDVSQFGFNGVTVHGATGTSGFNNVMISNVVAHDNAGGNANSTSGIEVQSGPGYSFGLSAPSHTNVTISNCTAFNNIGSAGQTNWSGSGIFIGQTSGGVIQNCVAHDNGSAGFGSVGIWTGDSKNVTIQFNEVYHQGTTAQDGDGFDIDGGCTNCVMQYNYSHDNVGVGYQLYAYNDGSVTTWDSNTCRFNISQNDGSNNPNYDRGGIAISQDSATMTNALVYGNTIYNNISTSVGINVRNSMTGRVANNIFYAGASIDIVHATANALVFTGNDYFSTGTFSINWAGTAYSSFAAWQTATGQEKIAGVNVGLTSDPMLINPGGGVIGLATAYKLQSGSPMVASGLDLNAQFSINPGTRDYFGGANPFGGSFSVGPAGGGSVI